jgi:hypothetical protein
MIKILANHYLFDAETMLFPITSSKLTLLFISVSVTKL